MTVQLSALGHVGLAKEVTPGTYVAPTLFVPYTSAKGEDIVEYVDDESSDANASKVRGVYQGVKDSSFDLAGHLYPEVPGFFGVALGLVDTMTGAGPYVHTLKFPASYAPQTSYSITQFQVVEARGYPGSKLDEFTITVDAKGTVKFGSKWMGFPSANQTTPTPSYASTAAFLGWESALTVGGTPSTRLLHIEFTFKRNTESVHPQNNTQAPREIVSGEIEASYKAKAIYDATTDFAHLASNDQPSLSLVLTAPGGGNAPVLTINMSKVSVEKAPVDMSQKYVQLDFEGKGIYNATDAGPFSMIVSNGTNSAY